MRFLYGQNGLVGYFLAFLTGGIGSALGGWISGSVTSLETAGEKITWTVRDGKLVFDLMPLIIEQVKLNGTIKLDTLSDYNNFSAIIDTSKLVIHVSDGVLADPTNQGE